MSPAAVATASATGFASTLEVGAYANYLTTNSQGIGGDTSSNTTALSGGQAQCQAHHAPAIDQFDFFPRQEYTQLCGRRSVFRADTFV